jgi:hypothetical protein
VSRQKLGAFGLGLTNEQLGCALAEVLSVGQSPDARGRLFLSAQRLANLLARPPRSDAAAAAAAWRDRTGPVVERLRPARHGLALEIDARGDALGLDPIWLTHVLLVAERVASLHFVTGRVRPAADWLWPLELGTLDDPRSRNVHQTLQDIGWKELARPVHAQGAPTPIELLFLPHSLAEAFEPVMAARKLPRIHTLVLLGGLGGAPSPLRLADALRAAARADAICVATVPETHHKDWVNSLLVELSHDLDLDVALCVASRAQQQPPPFLAATRGAFARAHVSRWAETVARRVRVSEEAAQVAVSERPSAYATAGAGPLEEQVATATLEKLPHALWEHESAEATDTAALGRAVRESPRKPTGRRVQAQLRDARTEDVIKYGLMPAHPYALDVWIGAPQSGALIAPVEFPDDELPPHAEGHWLTVVLTAPDVLDEPQVARLLLPPEEDSRSCRFLLQIPAGVEQLDARITILHENRVLQTLRLRAGIGTTARDDIEFWVEAVVQQNLEGLGGRSRFDAAVLFNDIAGQSTMTFYCDGRASLVRAEQLEKFISVIAKELEDVTNRPARYGRPDKPQTAKLLADLARQGAMFREALLEMPHVQTTLDSAKRLQIIAVNPDKPMPLEFCYDGPPPGIDATMCPGWQAALASGECPSGHCPADRKSVVCPIGFWGMHRTIERHAYNRADAARLQFNDFAIQSEPVQARRTLNCIEGSVFAASDKARTADPDAITASIQAINAMTTSGKDVRDWPDWKTEVGTRHPRLLVLLPHTDLQGATRTLEIGAAKRVLISDIDATFVAAEHPGPMVLLLGCETATHDVSFQSFVTQFRRAGASVVMGTLASVLGRHVGPVAKILAETLEAAHAPPGGLLGDVMCQLRRKALADGYPIVLAITAFGDADWRLLKS